MYGHESTQKLNLFCIYKAANNPLKTLRDFFIQVLQTGHLFGTRFAREILLTLSVGRVTRFALTLSNVTTEQLIFETEVSHI